jgi:hypothetical protein
MIDAPARLAVPIATSLASAGVGHVDTVLSGTARPEDIVVGGLVPADLNRPRSTAAAEAVTRVAPGTRFGQLRDGTATFVVQSALRRPAELTALAYARRSTPHLMIDVRDGTVVLGPLVPPAGSPCLACLDLHRRDRDPAWPALVAQLCTGPEGSQPCSVATALSATGYAVAEILEFIDESRAKTIGATVEIGSPGCERWRTWPPHPECECAHRRRRFSAG